MRGRASRLLGRPAESVDVVSGRMMRVLVACAVALSLAACKSPHQLREAAIAKAEAGCAARGKQFVLHDVHIDSSMNIGTATVNGACVGPGEPGWRDDPARAAQGAAPEAH